MGVQFSRIRLSVRFRRIFFPVDLLELVSILQETGYQLLLPPEKMSPGGGTSRVEASGTIASKGFSRLDINMERGILGITSAGIEQAIADFEDIETRLGSLVNVPDSAWFYEAILEGTVVGDEPAIMVVAGIAKGAPLFASMSEVWGEPLTNFGFRLIRTGQSPNQEEWLDIKIEPDVRRAEVFVFEGVHRSQEKGRVLTFMRSFTDRLENTIQVIAKGA